MQGDETKVCQNCRQPFVIDASDFAFYEKIQVPPPTWCPECRLVRRLMWRHNRTIYKNKCALCGEETLSVYHPSVPFPVYCPTCWWSDKWDAMKYGRDVDFSRPFLTQLFELRDTVPTASSWRHNSVNCRYCITEIDSKNCYFCYGSFRSEDCFYSMGPMMSRTCVDADLGMNMDHAYGSYNSDSIYRSKYLYFSEECLDSSFLFNCFGCTNCFGCVNLRHKQYCLFNKQLPKAEYETQMKYWDLGSYARTQEAQKKFQELYYATPHRFARVVNSPGSTGDNIKNSKNCRVCFVALDGVENSKYIFFSGLLLKDSYDVNYGGNKSQLMYESTSSEEGSSIFFSKGGKGCRSIQYCDGCINSQELFGCVQLRNKSYCIFNKQYSKEEYLNLKEKIIEHMNAMPYVSPRGVVYRYGEFFPVEFSPWKYNESFGFDWIPFTRDAALARGYGWREEQERNYAVTMKQEQLPDHIKDVPGSITNEIVGCAHARDGKNVCGELCSTAFRVIPEELAFYRNMNITLPRLCPNCRYFQRIQWRTPPKLWHRACMRPGCGNKFETAYSPDRKEILYCKDCYQQKFL